MDKTEIAVEIFDSRAAQYQDKFMNVDLYADSFNRFCEMVKSEKASVLEVACGPGNITRYLLDKRPDLQILGTDLAPNMIDLARKNNPEAEFQLLDARAIGTLGRRFDAIVCGFCFPYLSKSEALQFIADASEMLHPGGVLYISTMEGVYSEGGTPVTSSDGTATMNLFYHEAAYLEAELKKRRFQSISIKRQAYPGDGEVQNTDLLIVAERGN